MKKIILGAALAFVSLSLTSCLHDNEDLFDKPAAERMEEAVKADKELLESASNGWQMHFYTGEQYSGGGYTMFMKFKSGKAYVSSDIAPGSMVTSSSYDVISDRGPVITFNTYNMIMHYLASPSMSNVEGEQGDYEFVITKTTQDSIYVKGKKWGNKFVMTRVPADVSWEESINKMHAIVNSMRFAYLPEGAASADDAVMFDPSLRRVYVGSDIEGVPFYFNPDGIGFKDPVTIAGKEVSELKYDSETLGLSSDDNALKLNAYTPEGYRPLDDYLGSWNMSYQAQTESGSMVDAVQTFTLSPMADLINQRSQTQMLGQFKLGDYDFNLVFFYSPILGYAYINTNMMYRSPLDKAPYICIVPGKIIERDGKLYYGLGDGNINFIPNGDGSCAVSFDDPEATMILMLGIDGSGDIAGIVYSWDNPTDFVSAATGAKPVNPAKLFLNKNIKLKY